MKTTVKEKWKHFREHFH